MTFLNYFTASEPGGEGLNGLNTLDLKNSIQSATLVAYGKVRSFLTDEGRLGGGLTLATKSVAAGKRAFMQAFTVDCLLSHRGGLPVLRPLHRKERILFFAGTMLECL